MQNMHNIIAHVPQIILISVSGFKLYKQGFPTKWESSSRVGFESVELWKFFLDAPAFPFNHSLPHLLQWAPPKLSSPFRNRIFKYSGDPLLPLTMLLSGTSDSLLCSSQHLASDGEDWGERKVHRISLLRKIKYLHFPVYLQNSCPAQGNTTQQKCLCLHSLLAN